MGLRGFRFVASLIVAAVFVLSACSGSTSPPAASFTVGGGSGAAPLGVQFTDTSEGSVDTWAWDFGDGSTSAEQNPVHEYTGAGSFTVSLTVSNSGGSDEAAMAAAVEVQPGALTQVVFASEQVTVPVEGEAVAEAIGGDEFGNEIEDAELAWAVSENFPLSVGSIDQTGGFTAGTEAGLFDGLVEVTAAHGSDSSMGSQTVEITPGPLLTLSVEPAAATLGIGDSQAFGIVAMDEFSNTIPDITASWSTSADRGEIDPQGNFTAGTTAGSFTKEVAAEATSGGVTAIAKADVTIEPDPVDSIRIDPAPGVLEAGQTVQFIGAGIDEYGNVVAGVEVSEWSASDGEIDSAGLFTTTVEGKHQITASASHDGRTVSGSGLAVVPARVLSGQWFRSNPDTPRGLDEIERLDCPSTGGQIVCDYVAFSDSSLNVAVGTGDFSVEEAGAEGCEPYIATVCSTAEFVARGEATLSFPDVSPTPRITMAVQSSGNMVVGWDSPFGFYCPWYTSLVDALGESSVRPVDGARLQDCVGL